MGLETVFLVVGEAIAIGVGGSAGNQGICQFSDIEVKGEPVYPAWEYADGGGGVQRAVERECVGGIHGGRNVEVTDAIHGVDDHTADALIDGERGGDLKVKGDFIGHDFTIERDGDRVAEVSKKWFTLRDTYGVEVENRADSVLVLAVIVAVDSLMADSLMGD